jgi:hypothetical protein
MYRLQIFNLNNTPGFIAVTLAVGLSIASAGTPVIGFVNVKGMVQLDASPVAGHGTLFEGSTVETGIAGSQLEVPRKASLYLASASRAKIFADHMVLERGDSELSGSAGYWMEARGLQIGSVESVARARVSLRGNKQVMVAALSGPVRVENGRGVLVAWVASGRTLEFEPQDGATTPGLATLTGCLQKIDGHYILTDSTTGVKVELKGARAAEEAGNNVTVTGIEEPAGSTTANATELIHATEVVQNSKHCVVPGSAAAPAGATHGVASKVIIGGVLVAGAATGIVLGVTHGDKQPISR